MLQTSSSHHLSGCQPAAWGAGAVAGVSSFSAGTAAGVAPASSGPSLTAVLNRSLRFVRFSCSSASTLACVSAPSIAQPLETAVAELLDPAFLRVPPPALSVGGPLLGHWAALSSPLSSWYQAFRAPLPSRGQPFFGRQPVFSHHMSFSRVSSSNFTSFNASPLACGIAVSSSLDKISLSCLAISSSRSIASSSAPGWPARRLLRAGASQTLVPSS
mmetsp:Transcript_23269/g.65110  ORF Transcript_23269/g.65110 Transcript_23269/m.65110 type:complete len:216 (+) Transcript_23269:204-851(+)